MTAVHIVTATGGFKGYVWRVQFDNQEHYVHALSNYEAAEAVGLRFTECRVTRMALVEA